MVSRQCPFLPQCPTNTSTGDTRKNHAPEQILARAFTPVVVAIYANVLTVDWISHSWPLGGAANQRLRRNPCSRPESQMHKKDPFSLLADFPIHSLPSFTSQKRHTHAEHRNHWTSPLEGLPGRPYCPQRPESRHCNLLQLDANGLTQSKPGRSQLDHLTPHTLSQSAPQQNTKQRQKEKGKTVDRKRFLTVQWKTRAAAHTHTVHPNRSTRSGELNANGGRGRKAENRPRDAFAPNEMCTADWKADAYAHECFPPNWRGRPSDSSWSVVVFSASKSAGSF